MRFEWDETKSQANLRKHRVSFDEAETTFFDDEALVYEDPDHSPDEERFLLLGMSSNLRVLLVVHCLRQDGQAIRIISARKATKSERSNYPGGAQ